VILKKDIFEYSRIYVYVFCIEYPLNNLFYFIFYAASLSIVTCFANKAFSNTRYMGPWTFPELSLLICTVLFCYENEIVANYQASASLSISRYLYLCLMPAGKLY